MSKTIRVDDDTHAALRALKGDDQTYDDVISGLLEQRREAVRDGAGLWTGTDAAEKARDARKRMKDGVGQ
jgi:predicted CopG family antitoxin